MQVAVSFKESGVRSVLDPRTSLLAILVISMVMICGGLSGVEYYLRIICWMIPFVFLITMKKYKNLIFLLIGQQYASQQSQWQDQV